LLFNEKMLILLYVPANVSFLHLISWERKRICL